jgi:hypothetical protein
MILRVYIDVDPLISRTPALDLSDGRTLPKKRKPGPGKAARSNFKTRLATGPRQLARASGRKTGVGHGTVPPEPRKRDGR